MDILGTEYAKSRNIIEINITIYLDLPTHQSSDSQNNMPKDDTHLQKKLWQGPRSEKKWDLLS